MMTSYLGSLAYKSWKLTKIMPNSLKLLNHYILSNAPQKILQWALKQNFFAHNLWHRVAIYVSVNIVHCLLSLPDFIRWKLGTNYRFCRTEVNFTSRAQVMATCTKIWHWNFGSSLCTNNYRTKGITYYTLPSDPELQKGYRKGSYKRKY